VEQITETLGPLPLKSYQEAIFRRGSKTYFNASRFFLPCLRQRVFTLYAFVRRADDFVDSQPHDAEGFYRFRTYAEQPLGITPRHPFWGGKDPRAEILVLSQEALLLIKSVLPWKILRGWVGYLERSSFRALRQKTGQ